MGVCEARGAPVRRLTFAPASRGPAEWESLLAREWLVTNGLGGYACGSLSGVITRRYHGLLVAALPAPAGRTMMLNRIWERVRFPDRSVIVLSDEEHADRPPAFHGAPYLAEFALEQGLPVWRYELRGHVLERRVLMVHQQNTVHVGYRLVSGAGPLRLTLRPSVSFRSHNDPVSQPLGGPYVLTALDDQYELAAGPERPPLRLLVHPTGAFTVEGRVTPSVLFRVERGRGYDAVGDLWSPGYFRCDLQPGAEVTVVASTERWPAIRALDPLAARAAEQDRRRRLLAAAPAAARAGIGADLVLAADQFAVTPVGRLPDVARARAAGDEPRTVIAGYHWFTDWGRDTMIGLDGLFLATGRWQEARWVLRAFAGHVRDGLIPNLFPEEETEGRYHTADATLWFFHALDRYVGTTGDAATLRQLLPRLREIVERHLEGTRFGIGVDPADGLLRQGAPGYQLTWMDAKVDDWVVTPRRGKAVEINALWYNALRLLAGWLEAAGEESQAKPIREHAERAGAAFNARFWYEAGGYLYDVIDGEAGDDTACRPNQLLAIALAYPVLDAARWPAVLEVVARALLAPVGLRSLAPGHRDYRPRYDGDLRARDAAYHQGTVWAWLIGPWIDAWLRVHPGALAEARKFLAGFAPHLDEACVGSISEIFDAEAPYTPRGCVAQAWSVAEVLRCWVKTSSRGRASGV
jgi:predicted glycogen debranching enzyme